jgi:hypothetical protein
MDQPNHDNGDTGVDPPAPPNHNAQPRRPQRDARIRAINNMKNNIYPGDKYDKIIDQQARAAHLPKKAAPQKIVKHPPKHSVQPRRPQRYARIRAINNMKNNIYPGDKYDKIIDQQARATHLPKKAAPQKNHHQNNAKRGSTQSGKKTKLQLIASQSGRSQRGVLEQGEGDDCIKKRRYVSTNVTSANRKPIEGVGRRLKDGEVVKSNGRSTSKKSRKTMKEFNSLEEAMIHLCTENNDTRTPFKLMLKNAQKEQQARMRITAVGMGRFKLVQLKGGSSVPGGGRLLGFKEDYEPHMNNNKEESHENQQFSVSYYQGGIEGNRNVDEQVTIYPKELTTRRLEALYENCYVEGDQKMRPDHLAHDPSYFWSMVYHTKTLESDTGARPNVDDMLCSMLPHLEWSHLNRGGRKRQDSEKSKENKKQMGEAIPKKLKRDTLQIIKSLQYLIEDIDEDRGEILHLVTRIVKIMLIEEVGGDNSYSNRVEGNEGYSDYAEEGKGHDYTDDDNAEDEDYGKEEWDKFMNEYIVVDEKISDCMESIVKKGNNPIQWYCAMMLLHGVLRSLIHDDQHDDEYKTRYEDEEQGKKASSNYQHLEMQNELSFGAALQVAEENGVKSSGVLGLASITCDVLMIVATGLLAWTSSRIETPEAANKYGRLLKAFNGYNICFTKHCEDNREILADVAGRVDKASIIMMRLGQKILEKSIHEHKPVKESSRRDGREGMEESIHQYQLVKESSGHGSGEKSQEC